MNRLRLGLCAVLLLQAARMDAQVSEGNRLWEAGDFHAAAEAYRRELASDSTSVRSLYRLAVLASWDGKLDSALTLAARARRYEPGDADVRLLEAQVLSWKGELAQSIVRYDSVIATDSSRLDAQVARAHVLAWASRFRDANDGFRTVLARDPGNPGALAGLGQVQAWQGHLDSAVVLYRSALAADSTNADAKVGLAQAHFWQGRTALARRELAPVLARDPANHDAQVLDRGLRTAGRTFVGLEFGWNNDSDHNTSWWEAATVTVPVTDQLSVFGTAGFQQSTNPVLSAHRELGEAGFTLASRPLTITAAAGARRLHPDGGGDRTEPSVRGALTIRPTGGIVLGGGFTHHAFDETAQLIGGGLDVDELEGNLDLSVTHSTVVSVGGGRAWFSDTNRRYHVVAAATQQLPAHFFAGIYARQMGYNFAGTGYFSPGRFRIGEVRGGWVFESPVWAARIAGGLGAQEPFRGANTQVEWHAETVLARKWGLGNQVGVFGGISNSLERSVTGAYRFRTAGIRITIGL